MYGKRKKMMYGGMSRKKKMGGGAAMDKKRMGMAMGGEMEVQKPN
tara:strand:+ start:387 stop:521 length:135 start_codon:yes stop_codon:yes gene_type:complete